MDKPKGETAAAPMDGPTPEQRMTSIANAMNKARPLAESLGYKLESIYTNVRKLGVENIGGLGGFRLGVELTALKHTMDKLENLLSTTTQR